MNRLIFIVIAAIFLLNGCKKSSQFTISGKITHGEGQIINLEELLVSSTRPVASVKLNKKGEFKFKGEASIPTFYLLKLPKQNQFITLLIDSLENVHVEADLVNFSKQYIVKGSQGSILVKELSDELNSTRSRLDSLQSLNKLYKGNPDYEKLKIQWDQQYDSIVQEQVKFSVNFVKNHPFSMASVLALYQKFPDNSYIVTDLQSMRTAASALNSIYPNSDFVKALYQNTLQYLKEKKAAQVQKFIEENGANSPEIILPTPEGKQVALSSLRGKVVLLQFWDAEDRGSRIVNPTLVEAYKKYKKRGFDIYQVSVGKNRIEWVDAIDKDGLAWINVGDMEGSVRATQIYNIQAIPYNYLLDKNGVIVGQNLKGPDLNKAIAGLLK
ncbi:MAG: AhpC/TSA family protein [Prolixibacteraceae bacterium]|nr:AhpC/TSA family protein [Prolixibacteraceae bacterium]